MEDERRRTESEGEEREAKRAEEDEEFQKLGAQTSSTFFFNEGFYFLRKDNFGTSGNCWVHQHYSWVHLATPLTKKALGHNSQNPTQFGQPNPIIKILTAQECNEPIQCGNLTTF